MPFWNPLGRRKRKAPTASTAAPPPDPREDLISTLTPREREVFALLMQGKKLREIADVLGIKFSTVNTHQKGIYKKLGVNSRAECFVRFSPMGPYP